jgi:hypothetical protein
MRMSAALLRSQENVVSSMFERGLPCGYIEKTARVLRVFSMKATTS